MLTMPMAFGQEEALGAQKITLTSDNTAYQEGDVITITGKTQNILTAERTALNFLGLMSGIASKAKKFSDIANPYGSKIYSTRKTIAGIRKLEKYALTIGGAYINRETLDDFFFIKDNHLKTNSDIKECIHKLRKFNPNKKIDNVNWIIRAHPSEKMYATNLNAKKIISENDTHRTLRAYEVKKFTKKSLYV